MPLRSIPDDSTPGTQVCLACLSPSPAILISIIIAPKLCLLALCRPSMTLRRARPSSFSLPPSPPPSPYPSLPYIPIPPRRLLRTIMTAGLKDPPPHHITRHSPPLIAGAFALTSPHISLRHSVARDTGRRVRNLAPGRTRPTARRVARWHPLSYLF